MSASEKIHQAKMAFASGKLSTDNAGFLHVKGVGDIKLSDEFVASVGASTRRPAGSVTARWQTAVDAALISCNGNRVRATAMAARKHPHLRAQLIAEANSGRTQPKPQASQRPTAKVNSTVAFSQQVAELMEQQGMSKLEAARQLSQQMGLSNSQPAKSSGSFVSTRDQYR
jgi:hypothetical protein